MLPKDTQVDRELGFLCDKKGDLEQVKYYMRNAAQQNPRDAELQYNLGLMLSRGDKPDLADVVLQRVGKLDPKNGKACSTFSGIFARGHWIRWLFRIQPACIRRMFPRVRGAGVYEI